MREDQDNRGRDAVAAPAAGGMGAVVGVVESVGGRNGWPWGGEGTGGERRA